MTRIVVASPRERELRNVVVEEVLNAEYAKRSSKKGVAYHYLESETYHCLPRFISIIGTLFSSPDQARQEP
jgi:hypothetical protein